VKEDVVGLDIGDGYVAAAKVRPGSGRFLRVTHAGCVRYGSGAPRKEIASAIRDLWRRCRMPTYTVCSCLRSPSVAVRHFRHSALSQSELESALRLQAEEALHKPAGDVVVDWVIDPDGAGAANGGGGDAREGVFVAAARHEVQDHLSLLEAAGLFPIIVDTTSLAVANLFLRLERHAAEEETVCVAHVHGHSADIVVLHGGGAVYPRTLFFPASMHDGAPEFLSSHINDELRYFQYKLRKPAVTRLYLSGQTQGRGKLTELLSEKTEVPVEPWDPMQSVKLGRGKAVVGLDGDSPDPGVMITCLGLGLRGV
jgi:Tfp pilus assembly PilM family ATPase